MESEAYPLVVHSHLRWEWVWQRPQQFLSRLSRRHPVLFVEEPVMVEGLASPQAEFHGAADWPNVTILQPHLPSHFSENRKVIDDAVYRIVKQELKGPLSGIFAQPVQWFYDPMAVTPFALRLGERLNVYDCMDQLSQFRGAPPDLVRREKKLLALADVVFAGGPRIHDAKSPFNPNCHCYGCGVDVKHFGKAMAAATGLPADLAALPAPRLGYFGVVDERMDYELVSKLADAYPDWSVVLIGPWTKVDPATFPRRRNLHWLGGRDYQQLPGYVKGLDVCLIPFAMNEATEYVNPTKALEYMACGKPVVSTPIRDVVAQFAGIVSIGKDHDEFIGHCDNLVSNPDSVRIQRGLDLAKQNSWEAIVDRLDGHIADALEARRVAETVAA